MKMFDDENSKLLGAHFTFNGCPTFEMKIGGNCPVQATGIIGDDQKDKFYFRARGEHWQFEVYDGENTETEIYTKEGEYGDMFEAGWMPINECLKIIGKQVIIFWHKIGAFRRIKKVWGQVILDKYKDEIREQNERISKTKS